MTRYSRLNSPSGIKNKRLLFKVVKTNWTHNNRPFLDTQISSNATLTSDRTTALTIHKPLQPLYLTYEAPPKP